MDKHAHWPFELPTVEQLHEWMPTANSMISSSSYPQGYIANVNHKTRQVTERCSQFILARCDGLRAEANLLAPLLSEYLRLGYRPYLHPPYGNEDQLVLDLENEPYTAYARAVLQYGGTMTLHAVQYYCFPAKDTGVPIEELMYDFDVEEMKETATNRLQINIYGLPLHLWTIKAIERILRQHCIVEQINYSNLNFQDLQLVASTAWSIDTPTPFPYYILIHVSSRNSLHLQNPNDAYRETKTYCVGIDTSIIAQHSQQTYPNFLQALTLGRVSQCFLNKVDVSPTQLSFLESAFCVTWHDKDKAMSEENLAWSLRQMHTPFVKMVTAKQIDKFKYLIYFDQPAPMPLLQALQTDLDSVQLPFGRFSISKWSMSIGAASTTLSEKYEVKVGGLPTEFYSPSIIEDILSPYCMLDNNKHQVLDSPHVFYYKCIIWTNESIDMPDNITIWCAPNGLAVEASPSQCFSVPLCVEHAVIIRQ